MAHGSTWSPAGFSSGFGVTGLYSVDITLMQEFVPAQKRGWLTGLTTTMLPAGVLLAGLLGAFADALYRLARDVRGRVAARVAVPLHPRLGARIAALADAHGRVEEARHSLAWALQMDPAKIALPATPPAGRAHPLDRDVQVSAQHHRRMPHRPDPDRRSRVVPVDGDAVRHGAEDHPARGVEAGRSGSACRRSPAGSSARGSPTRWAAARRAC